jgi:hypothetical protein
MSRREALEALGLSPPLLALVRGERSHPAIPRVCRLISPDRAPRPDEPAGLVSPKVTSHGRPERTPAAPRVSRC